MHHGENLTAHIKSLDLVEVISRYIDLKPGTHGSFGRCPFHSDTDPSLLVKENRWRCFGCGQHGDVVDFIQLFNGLNFVQACAYLGLEVATMKQMTSEQKKEFRRKAAKYREQRKAAEERRCRISDLTYTLGKMLFEMHKGQGSSLLWYKAEFEYWVHSLMQGDERLKDQVLQDLKDFPTIDRQLLWDKSFDYSAWLNEFENNKSQKTGDTNVIEKVEVQFGGSDLGS